MSSNSTVNVEGGESFDTLFDYTPVITYFNERITELELEQADCTKEINIMSRVGTFFTPVLQEQLEFYTNKIQHLDLVIGKIRGVLSKINEVTTLPEQTKDLLFRFYQLYGKSDFDTFNYKVHWMRQLVYGHQDMIPYIEKLLTSELSDEEKKSIGDNICYTFDAKLETSSFHHVLLDHKIKTDRMELLEKKRNIQRTN